MATEKTIVINATTQDAVKAVEELKDKIEGAGDEGKEAGKKIEKSNKNISKSANKSNKAVRGIGKGFKFLGTAMKAAGIGLVVAIVAKLTEAFSRNQTALDGVNKVMETINIVFTEVTTAITNAFKKVSDATNGFEKLTKVAKGLITIGLTPLKLLFDGIKLTIQQAQLVWEKSFFGDGDPETIKELREGIKETKESIKETGEEAVKAGKDVVQNYGGMVNELFQFYEEANKGINDISVENSKASADRIVQLRKEAELAEAQLGGLTLKFQQQAEVLRQERDDIRLSIEDRIKANEQLGEVLQKQSEEELKLANKRLALANEELRLNPKNIENQKALQEALNGVAEVEERITGQKSEQRTNEAALLDERKANLDELRKIGLTEQALAKQESEQQLTEQKQLIERTVSNKKEQDRLIEEAEREHKDRLKVIEDEARIEREEFLRAHEEENAMQKLEREEQEALAELERLKLSEEEKQKVRDFYADKKAKLEQDAIEQRLNEEEILKNQIIASTAQTFGQISNILGEQSKEGKAFAVAQALMNTYQGISAGVALGFPKAIPAIIAASTTGFKAVKDIMSTNVESPSASGGGGARGVSQPQAQAPAFNIVGDSGTNQIADVLGQNANAPSRAYVVSSDVTSSQELDRNIESNASL